MKAGASISRNVDIDIYAVKELLQFSDFFTQRLVLRG